VDPFTQDQNCELLEVNQVGDLTSFQFSGAASTPQLQLLAASEPMGGPPRHAHSSADQEERLAAHHAAPSADQGHEHPGHSSASSVDEGAASPVDEGAASSVDEGAGSPAHLKSPVSDTSSSAGQTIYFSDS